MYIMNYNENKKIFHITVSGFFKQEDGENFLEDYNKNLETFGEYDKTLKNYKAKDVSLIIESEDLKASAQNMLETMKKCYLLYNSSEFKKMFIILPKSATAAGQAKRMAKLSGYIGEFAKSLDEAYSLANT